MITLADTKLAIIGLGYVGLPLAVAFGKRITTVGFDIQIARITELRAGKDSTLEIEPAQLRDATKLSFTANHENVKDCNVYIVTVPTPITRHRQPDLTPLHAASKIPGSVISKGDVAEAAGSKWNFLPFRPGLVGGHCVAVDPYHLTHKAQEIGYHPIAHAFAQPVQLHTSVMQSPRAPIAAATRIHFPDTSQSSAPALQ